jgi:hypothetical protein
VYRSPDQAAHYHILGLGVYGFISDPTFSLSQSKKIRYLHFPLSVARHRWGYTIKVDYNEIEVWTEFGLLSIGISGEFL